jgi:hypothetical protein
VQAARNRDSILHNNVKGRQYVTTRDVLLEEQSMIDFTRNGRATRDKLGGYGTIDLDPALSDEQREAALLILNSRNKVTGLKGGAGTAIPRRVQCNGIWLLRQIRANREAKLGRILRRWSMAAA